MISLIVNRISNKEFVETFDLTRYINDEAKVLIADEYERDAFFPTIPDVSLNLSDMNRELFNKFFLYPVNTVWKLNIFNNNEVKFRGFINPELIVREQNSEFITIDAFSTMGKFWEIAENIKLGSIPADDYSYRTTEEAETGYYSFLNLFRHVFEHFFKDAHIIRNTDFDSTILVRSETFLKTGTRIAGSSWQVISENFTEFLAGELKTLTDYDVNWIGNKVRLSLLRGNLKDLLLAIAKRNNSEWYIDLEGETLKLGQRNSIRNDLAEDLSHKVKDENDINISFSDEKRYDYVSVYSPITSDNIPKLVSVVILEQQNLYLTKPGRPLGYYEYTMTIIDSKNREIWCSQSLEVETVKLPSFFSIEERQNVFFLCSITMTIPAVTGFTDVKKRRLYRRCKYAVGGGVDESFYNGYFLFVAEFQGNTEATFSDLETEKDFIQRVAASAESGNIALNTENLTAQRFFLKYNDSAGSWTLEYNSENEPPNGTVFDTTSYLTFAKLNEKGEITGEEKTTIEGMYHFFGGNIDLVILQNQWKDLMINKRKIELQMEGNELKCGDAFTLKNIAQLSGIDKLVVKRTRNELIGEDAELELIAV